MEHFIVIRDYKPGDELQCREIIKDGTMATVNTAFLAGLTREITFQIMILTAAVMFIFFGFPFTICLGSIPGVILFVYFSIWSAHMYKYLEMSQDLSNIPRVYMSSDFTGFWVAEVYEPVFFTKDREKLKYPILRESEFQEKNIDVKSCHKQIVGTIAIVKSVTTEGCAWMRRMAVIPKYQRKGVASALVNEALQFCSEKDYVGVELVTTECHDNARDLYMKKGFQMKQMYHKQIIGSIVTVLMYELYYKIKSNKLNATP